MCEGEKRAENGSDNRGFFSVFWIGQHVIN